MPIYTLITVNQSLIVSLTRYLARCNGKLSEQWAYHHHCRRCNHHCRHHRRRRHRRQRHHRRRRHHRHQECLDSDPDDFRNLISSIFNTDTSLVKFS